MREEYILALSLPFKDNENNIATKYKRRDHKSTQRSLVNKR